MPKCPHCDSAQTHRNGSFTLKDGTRRQRWLCRECGRSFSATTGTPLHYLKKREAWCEMVERMNEVYPLRAMAKLLGVQLSTAFRWRHRLLSVLCKEPQPTLEQQVVVTDTFIPYSEKGRRPAAKPVQRPGERNQRSRRLVDRRPSFVLLASNSAQEVAAHIGQGRPLPKDLQTCIAALIKPDAELCSLGLAPYAQACQNLNLMHRDLFAKRVEGELPLRAHYLRRQFHGWLWRFRGVATRYLHRYARWFQVRGQAHLLRAVGAASHA